MQVSVVCSGGSLVSRSQEPAFYLDLPTKDGVLQADVVAKWTASAPQAFVDQYIDSLRQYRAISMDVGDKDGLKTGTGKLHDVLV